MQKKKTEKIYNRERKEGGTKTEKYGRDKIERREIKTKKECTERKTRLGREV